MALTESKPVVYSRYAPDFSLPGVWRGEERTVSLADFSQAQALVVVFMCNHCPYVIAVQERINQLARDYASRGVALVAINANDSTRYPDDSFAEMKKRAQEQGYVFPYLVDATQSVARAYDAVCTPDFFAYGRDSQGWIEKYRGRMDDSWKDESKVTRRDLRAALDLILKGEAVAEPQIPSMGCSIKWK